MNSATDTQKEKKAVDYAQLAAAYITERLVSAVFFQDVLYRYDGTRYVAEKQLCHKVRQWLIQQSHPHNNHVVSNVVGCIQAMRLADDSRYPSMPFYNGKKEDFPANVIVYKNGLLDVDAWLLRGDTTLLPHTPRWISTVCLPYCFDPSARCPFWEQTIGEVFDGDTFRIDLLQEWFGYTLLPDTSYHKLLIKVGPPRAFKGTSDKIHEALLGSDNTTAYNLHSLAERFGLGRLVGKQVAFVGEINLSDAREKVRILETLNSIVGQDPQSIESKGKNECLSIVLPTRFSLSCNEMPSFHDTCGALYSRLLVLPFDNSFVGREDRELFTKLLAEISGIANWALDGLQRLRTNKKFSESPRGGELISRFRRNSSDAVAFMQDCLEVDPSINPGNLDRVRIVPQSQPLTRNRLHDVYSKWCQENGLQGNGVWLDRNLQSILPKMETKRVRIAGIKTMTYYGIGIYEEAF